MRMGNYIMQNSSTQKIKIIFCVKALFAVACILAFSSCGVPTNDINVECLKANCLKVSDLKMKSEMNTLSDSQNGNSVGFQVNAVRGGGVAASAQTGTSPSFKLKGGVTGAF